MDVMFLTASNVGAAPGAMRTTAEIVKNLRMNAEAKGVCDYI